MAVPYRPKPTYPPKPRPQQGPQGKQQQGEHRINSQITAPQVRVVGDELEGAQVMSIRDALALADQMELDLIEISPKAEPPVCRIADYQKFLYQQKKKAKEIKAKQTKVVINFLQEGAKVKAYVFFRGRSIVFSEQGQILLLRFATDLEEYGKVEMMPKLEGKRMTMMLAPKPKK